MRKITRVVASLLALTWVLLSCHCLAENLPGFEFLKCAPEVEATAHEHGDPCEDGDCCSVESAKYQTPRQRDASPIPILVILPLVDAAIVEHSLPSEVALGVLTAAPPDLRSSWQFSFRAALPPRAPSLVS